MFESSVILLNCGLRVKKCMLAMAGNTHASFEDIMSTVRTVGDAFDALNLIFNTQIDRAETQNTAPNEGVEGDSSARNLFLSFLPTHDQRAFFLTMIRNSRFWPRIRTLVGSPPFTFLREEDDAILRPAGIAQRRLHMATSDSDISSYTSFGSAHFVDDATRDFKVIDKRQARNIVTTSGILSHTRRLTELPFVNIEQGDAIILEVRLKKRSIHNKIMIARGKLDVPKDAVIFPRIGTSVHLKPSTRLRSFIKDVTVRVVTVQARLVSSNVARLHCTVV
jgi:hypothetical protein